MTIKYILGAVVVCMSLHATSAHAIPTTYLYDGSGQITGVAALDINGTRWDMTLHDGSIASLYEELGSDVLYEEGFALDASAALVSFTNTQNDSANTFFGCHNVLWIGCSVATVYELQGRWPNRVYSAYVDRVSDSSPDLLRERVDYDAWTDSDYDTFATWARHVEGVPEPSVVLLIASGLMVYGIARRKDRT